MEYLEKEIFWQVLFKAHFYELLDDQFPRRQVGLFPLLHLGTEIAEKLAGSWIPVERFSQPLLSPFELLEDRGAGIDGALCSFLLKDREPHGRSPGSCGCAFHRLRSRF
jgi:hypothetical protein